MRRPADVVHEPDRWQHILTGSLISSVRSCRLANVHSWILAAEAEPADPTLCLSVNNAGRNIRKSTVDVTSEDYQTIMSTNLESSFALCQVSKRIELWIFRSYP
jgi:NAD(P)-dependent dehydrogenase (short-subunit alcohol dehydrogenase family)